MLMEHLHFSCQGESHKATNKVCQDYSYSQVDEKGLAIAVVCDGHGGQRYFRSDVGARLAGEITVKNISVFVEGVDRSLFADQPYTTATALATQVSNAEFNKERPTDRALRQLFASIIFEWTTQIKEHAASTPLVDAEKEGLQPEWIAEFNEGQSLEKVYGCTLMAYVNTPNYWFAFHIGDGKCIAFDEKGQWNEPIPWDDRCFLNRTTSLCDAHAIDEFRYCYEGDGGSPIAIFLASDGIDDSFGEENNMVNFYVQILKKVKTLTNAELTEEVATTLPELSRIGSRDDMSIALVYDAVRVKAAYSSLLQWQIDVVKADIGAVNLKITEAQERIAQLEAEPELTRKIRIDHDYAVAEKTRAFATKATLVKRINLLLQEMYGDNFMPYKDGIVTDDEEVEVKEEDTGLDEEQEES